MLSSVTTSSWRYAAHWTLLGMTDVEHKMLGWGGLEVQLENGPKWFKARELIIYPSCQQTIFLVRFLELSLCYCPLYSVQNASNSRLPLVSRHYSIHRGGLIYLCKSSIPRHTDTGIISGPDTCGLCLSTPIEKLSTSIPGKNHQHLCRCTCHVSTSTTDYLKRS